MGITLVTATVTTLGLGAHLVWQGELTIGALTAFNMYPGQLIWPMFAAGWVLSLIERGRRRLGRLQPVLDEPLPIDELINVTFSYPGHEALALSGLQLHLPSGQTLGLVGPTGSGKSSVLRLILRQYAAQSGQVRWGRPLLGDYQLAALNRAISWVPQEFFSRPPSPRTSP